MHRYFELFGSGKPDWNGRTLFAVIHLPSRDAFEAAYRDTVVARDNGADGVFLIDMGVNLAGQALVDLAHEIACLFPGYFVGINDLSDWGPAATIRRVAGTAIQGVWSDRSDDQESIEAARRDTGWQGLFFGGVVFKYQADFDTPDDKLAEVIQPKLAYVDIVSTSGPSTGRAIDVNRLQKYREAAGPQAIVAVCSGVTEDNVSLILPHANALLVSSSIVDSNDRLVGSGVAGISQQVRDWQPSVVAPRSGGRRYPISPLHTAAAYAIDEMEPPQDGLASLERQEQLLDPTVCAPPPDGWRPAVATQLTSDLLEVGEALFGEARPTTEEEDIVSSEAMKKNEGI